MAEDNSWHLDKKVPIALIGVLFLQTIALVRWGIVLDYRVEDLEKDTIEHVQDFRLHEEKDEAEDLRITGKFDRIMEKLTTLAVTLEMHNQKADKRE